MMAVSLHRAPLRALATLALLLTGGALASPAFAQADANKQDPPKETPVRGGIPVIGPDEIDPNQAIKPEFIITVTVRDEPEPSATYPVDAAGNISIKFAGVMTPISVKDMTPPQAADAIAKFLKAYIKNPNVTVTIRDVPRPTVFVAGGVRAPGPIVITNDTTLVDVLSRIGWAENADLTQVRVSREETINGKTETVARIYDFDAYIKVEPGKVLNEANNPVLKKKDRIFVPIRALPGTGRVSITGEVGKPQQELPLRSSGGTTIREIINLVGGTTVLANRKSVVIRRAGFDRPLIIDLDKAEQGDVVNNIELKPDDSIYVEKLENNAYINVNGGFVKTGKMIYDKRMTLTQAIQDSGGIAPFARTDTGRIFRHPTNDPKDTQIIAFDWKKIQDGKLNDVELLPGDSVWLQPGQPPKPAIDLFTVINALSQGVFLYNNLTGNFGFNNNNGGRFF